MTDNASPLVRLGAKKKAPTAAKVHHHQVQSPDLGQRGLVFLVNFTQGHRWIRTSCVSFKDLRRDRRNASSSGPSLRDPSFRKTSADRLLTCTPHTPAPYLRQPIAVAATSNPRMSRGAHDDTQLLGSCKCHCCTGIGFFKDLLLREFFHTPAPTTTKKPDLCLCQENEVGGHACTGCNTLQLLCQEVGCPYHEELRSTPCCVALVVLWMGLHQEKFPLLATTLQAAAGVSGPQKWR